MNRILKEVVVPRLRADGFRGSLPHFRRSREDVIDLLTFQFRLRGGEFAVELGQCSATGQTTPSGEHVSPRKVTTFHADHSHRMGMTWIKFGRPSWEKPSPGGESAIERDCRRAAAEMLQTYAAEAENWWRVRQIPFQELVDRYLSEPHPERELKLAREMRVLPVHQDSTDRYYFREDGRLLTADQSQYPLITLVTVDDAERRTMVLSLGSDAIPQLRRLLPRRPERAIDCDACQRSGRSGSTLEAACTHCGALGWQEP